MPTEKGRVGSSFEDYLAKEGILEGGHRPGGRGGRRARGC